MTSYERSMITLKTHLMHLQPEKARLLIYVYSTEIQEHVNYQFEHPHKLLEAKFSCRSNEKFK